MNQYASAALVAFTLLTMGLVACVFGTANLIENRKSKTVRLMCLVCWSVFFWNFGYAWMSICYYDEIAYVARAVALFGVSLYMVFAVKYIIEVTNYPKKIVNTIMYIIFAFSIIAWSQIIRKDAVEFTVTPWGYWYVSKMSWARILQFMTILATLVVFYVVLSYGKKAATTKRERYVLNHFSLFGPILISGCLLDTIIPTLFRTAAVPGSSIAAFASAMLFFRVSQKNKTFGLSVTNVSRYVFEDVSMPVVITNAKKKIIMFNKAATEYFNCNDEQLIDNEMNSFLQEGENESYKVINSDLICKLDRTDVRDQFGEMLYSIFFIGDITKEIENLRIVDESREIAEKANRAKSEFLANMSHEIRTPMNAVLGIDEMILRESKDPAVLDYAQSIKQAGNILLSLINDILDFSKIESGKMDINPVEFHVAGLLTNLYTLISEKAKDKGLGLKIDMDPKIPSVLYGDDVRISQIIINILNNSIKYTEKGLVSLAATLVAIENGAATLHVSVVDTGIGIKEEDLPNLFNAFERVDVVRNRNIEGTGLGLSITNKLLNLMGSKLQVKSEYGKGSEFYFDLTLKIMDETPVGNVDIAVAKPKKSRKTEATFTAPAANILIVDDNRTNLKVASGLLKRTEVVVTTASSGPESIELVKQNKYDLIMMDHMMPGMDGIEATGIIRALDDYPSKGAPIIALTANAVSGAKEMFLENGFDDFIAKPIKVDELEEKLIKYLPEDKVNMIKATQE